MVYKSFFGLIENIGGGLMKSKLLVIGAGTDKSMGMPLASELLGEMAAFADDEGKEISDFIKSFLPHMRFSLKKFIDDAVDSILYSGKRLLIDIKTAAEEMAKSKIDSENETTMIHSRAELGALLIEKVISLQDASRIDDKTIELIKESFSDKNTALDDEFILELKKASFSETFKTVMKKLLKDGLSSTEDPISQVLSQKMLDVERLLVNTFSGFYTKREADIKKYIYISWLLWAYLVYRQNIACNKIHNDSGTNSFYSSIKENFFIISFNYTDFLRTISPVPEDNYLYFHGSLNKYIRTDTKDTLDIPELPRKESILEFLKENIAPNVSFDKEIYVLPNIVPPLKMKPVISSEFLDTWYKAKNWLREANEVIIVGYSFNYADEHFNDILRKNKGNQSLKIFDPHPEIIKTRISKILGNNENSYTEQIINRKKCWQYNNEIIQEAYAEEIDFSEI